MWELKPTARTSLVQEFRTGWHRYDSEERREIKVCPQDVVMEKCAPRKNLMEKNKSGGLIVQIGNRMSKFVFEGGVKGNWTWFFSDLVSKNPVTLLTT